MIQRPPYEENYPDSYYVNKRKSILIKENLKNWDFFQCKLMIELKTIFFKNSFISCQNLQKQNHRELRNLNNHLIFLEVQNLQVTASYGRTEYSSNFLL